MLEPIALRDLYVDWIHWTSRCEVLRVARLHEPLVEGHHGALRLHEHLLGHTMSVVALLHAEHRIWRRIFTMVSYLVHSVVIRDNHRGRHAFDLKYIIDRSARSWHVQLGLKALR